MISGRLKDAICRELGLDDLELDDATTADQVPGWDSLHHAAVICAVEAEYGVRFTTMEVLRLRNVGELQVLVDSKRPRG
jgi:acyl carrier protein